MAARKPLTSRPMDLLYFIFFLVRLRPQFLHHHVIHCPPFYSTLAPSIHHTPFRVIAGKSIHLHPHKSFTLHARVSNQYKNTFFFFLEIRSTYLPRWG